MPSEVRFVPLEERPERVPWPLPPCEDTPRGRLAVSQGGCSRHWALSVPCLGPPSRRTVRGDFVTAAHMGMAMWRHD